MVPSGILNEGLDLTLKRKMAQASKGLDPDDPG
jgi:hypothetical protein